MRSTLVAVVALSAMAAACESPTAPSIAQDADAPQLGKATPTWNLDPAEHDENGNGVVCVKPADSGNARGNGPANRPTIVMDDDGSGSCRGGFEAIELAGPSTLAAGKEHACALDEVGQAWCWGTNMDRALGVEGIFEALEPVRVEGAPVLVELTAGNRFTCGLDEGGTVWCWGSNRFGQLGIGDPFVFRRAAPEPVLGGITFRTIDAGENFVCGIATDDELYCWGSNDEGALGVTTSEQCGITPCATTPTRAGGDLLFESVSGGVWHACGVARDGVAYCWGGDDFHQGGDGAAVGGPTPAPVASPPDLTAVDAGAFGACGIDVNGAGYCWGDHPDGLLGTGSAVGSATPVAVAGDHEFTDIQSAKGNQFTWFQCGIDADGAAWCWGSNLVGQIGTTADLGACEVAGFANSCAATPHRVDGGHSWSEIAVGNAFACGRAADGQVYCWGLNAFGALGDGTTTSRSVPAPVAFGAL